MDDALAHKRLSEVLDLIDRYDEMYDRRWGHGGHTKDRALDSQLHQLEDDVRGQTRFARDVITAMGDKELAAKVEEHSEVMQHSFIQARKAIVEAIAILAQREELARITGPVGPRLSASELHPAIWGAAAALWDNDHFRQAVQTAATALEGLLQAIAGPAESGEKLAGLFSTNPPAQGSPRLRLRKVDPHRRRGNQLKTARPHWCAAHSRASAT
jgi:hypothetical protein